MDSEKPAAEIVLVPYPDGEWMVQYPREFDDELAEPLHEAGVSRMELREAGVLDFIKVIVSPESIAGVVAVLHALNQRHKHRRFKYSVPGGETIEAAGMSEKEMQRHIRSAREQYDQGSDG